MSIDVSVVMPTFRRPELLAEAVDSVLAQTGLSLEVIVLDDSPEGSAAEVIAQINDPRIRYVLRTVPSRGKPAIVRNEGARIARGRFVHFLDDDDRVPLGVYSAALDAFAENPNCGVLFGRVESFGEDAEAVRREQAYFDRGARKARVVSSLGSRFFMVAILMFDATPLVSSSCMIRRECIEALAGYDPEIPVCEDVDFYLRAIRQFGYTYLDRVMVHYRFQSNSLMHRQKDSEAAMESYRIIQGNYRSSHGLVESLALKALARTALGLL